MYPYSHTIQNMQTRETTKDPAIQELSQDDRLLSLLRLAIEDTIQMQERYRRLLSEAPVLEPSKELIQSLYLDEKKHLRQLQDVLFLITGKRIELPDESQIPSTLEKIDPFSYIEETLLQELDASEFHRNFFLSIPDGELRDLFFEILSDKQTHANVLTYLLGKYF